MISWTNITDVAAELGAVPVAVQTALLAVANARCPDDVWGAQADVGRAYLAAHLGTLAMRRGAGGPVTEQHAGPVGASYGLLLSEGLLGTTSYGQVYALLVSTLVEARLPVIGGV